jgi:ribonucleotide reductase beta subunit family protein with ferritin-like domain
VTTGTTGVAAGGGASDAATGNGESPDRFDRLLHEIDALIDRDETDDRTVSGGWKTFADISAAADAHAWDAYSIDLSVDAKSFRNLERDQQDALLRVFGTIYRAESIVDDWMDRIVAAIPREEPGASPDPLGYDALRTALKGQEHDEKMHRGSLVRVGAEVLGIDPEEVDRVARKYNNFVAETLFARFNEQMRQLLRPGRPLEDVYTAIFIYGILSEDVVANSDVVIRRAKGRGIYDGYNLPGMKEGQTNVRRDEGRHVRIAVLATRRYLAEYEGAAARLSGLTTEYMDMADNLLRDAKRSHGVIDAHLLESYGPDVDSLYYYVMNMKRLAVRLDELGLRACVIDVRRRVEEAVTRYTDDERRPIVETPNVIVRKLGPRLLRLSDAVRTEA